MLPEASSAWNSTNSGLVVNSVGLAPLLFIGILVIAVGGLAIIITSMERFSWFMDLVNNAVNSIKYTVYGVGISGVGLLCYAIFNMLMTATKGFDPIWYVYAIGVYVGLTVLGWVGANVAGKVKVMHTLYLESKPKPLVTVDE